MLGREEQLEAIFPGVAGAGDPAVDAADLAVGEPVVLQRAELCVGERLKNPDGLRSLHRQQTVPVSIVLHRGCCRVVLDDPLVVLVLVRGIDHQEEVIFGHAINQQIVGQRSLRIHQAVVVGLPDGKSGRVIAGDFLQESEGMRTLQLDLSHVADVEQAGGSTHGHVLGGNAAVLHRHIPPAEIHHLGFQRAVDGIQCSASQRIQTANVTQQPTIGNSPIARAVGGL